jgi:peptide/nickel transport system permease protein
MSDTHEHPRGRNPWLLAWRRYRRDGLALAGLVLVLVMAVTAVFAPLLANGLPLLAKVDGHWLSPALLGEARLRSRGLTSWEGPRVTAKVMPPIPYGPDESDFSEMGSPPYPPSRRHPLGTDDRCRDVLARMIWGARVSLSVGFVAVGIAMVIGVIGGALAGYYGG